jgi:hypothetical protein
MKTRKSRLQTGTYFIAFEKEAEPINFPASQHKNPLKSALLRTYPINYVFTTAFNAAA